MAEITQNVDSGMTPPTPEAIGMSLFMLGGRAYQPMMLMIPQVDPDTAAEIVPARVGNTLDGFVPLPTYDQLNESTFLDMRSALIEISNATVRMPYGSQRGVPPGQAILTDDIETPLLADPYSSPTSGVDLKCIVIDNDSDSACRVFIRPAPASATVYPSRCPSKETKMYVFSGVGPQGAGNGVAWTAQLETAPSGGNVTVSAFGIQVDIA